MPEGLSPEQVHVRDASGRLLYTRLLDDGTNVLPFASGSGHICRDQAKRERWSILPGWPAVGAGKTANQYREALEQETIQRRHDWIVRGDTDARDWAPGTKPTAMDRALGGAL